jgi:hypothetical protein
MICLDHENVESVKMQRSSRPVKALPTAFEVEISPLDTSWTATDFQACCPSQDKASRSSNAHTLSLTGMCEHCSPTTVSGDTFQDLHPGPWYFIPGS